MPSPLDDYITQTLNGLPSSTVGAGQVDPNQILKDRPDVLAGYNNEATRDAKSKQNLQQIGVYSPQDFATWWYNNQGRAAGYVPSNAATAQPTTTADPGTGTTPPTAVPGGTNANPTAAPGSASYLADARARALANAHLAVSGLGLDPGSYDTQFNSYLDDLFGHIPAGDTNPQSYIDPNFASTILNGQQSQLRRADRSAVTAKYANPHLDYHSLDDTINSILGDADKSGNDLLNNGLKRGQFNEAGFAGGQAKLAAAKAKAQAKLDSTADDVLNSYGSQYSDLYTRALTAASGEQLGDNLDFSPYDAEFSRIGDRAKTDAKGKLYSAIGDAPLIDLSDIRGAAGQAQGATNLTDLDVLDATAKRKQASGVGRGLGSQGAF